MSASLSLSNIAINVNGHNPLSKALIGLLLPFLQVIIQKEVGGLIQKLG